MSDLAKSPLVSQQSHNNKGIFARKSPDIGLVLNATDQCSNINLQRYPSTGFDINFSRPLAKKTPIDIFENILLVAEITFVSGFLQVILVISGQVAKYIIWCL